MSDQAKNAMMHNLVVELLHEPRSAGLVLELVSGEVPLEAAVAAVLERET